MRKRTLAREFALQVLYQRDITRDNYSASLHDFWQTQDADKIDDVVAFTPEEL